MFIAPKSRSSLKLQRSEIFGFEYDIFRSSEAETPLCEFWFYKYCAPPGLKTGGPD